MELNKTANSYYSGELLNILDISPSIINKARLEYIRKIVPKKNNERIETTLSEGYVEKYKTPKSIAFGLNKKHDIAWEERVWAIFAKMGYHYTNVIRNFKLSYGNDLKQIDVFAADSETILIIECKSSNISRIVDHKEEILSWGSMIEGLRNSSQRIIPGKQKIAFIWATNNCILNEPSKKALQTVGFYSFNQNDISYYEQMSSHIGTAAKYQLSAKLFSGQKIPELQNINKIPAISGKLGGKQYYLFSIDPAYLLKTSFIFHRSDTTSKKLETYQRVIKKSRLKQIREFVSNDGYFANSLIANIYCKRKLQFDVQFSKKDSEGKRLYNTSIGILHLPIEYKSIWIIDGQHRLYGYSDAELNGMHSVSVLAFENLDGESQKKLFVAINSNQKPVSSNLLKSLMAEFKYESSELNEGLPAFKTILIQELNDREESPLYQRIVLSEEAKTNQRCLTLSTLLNWGLKGSSRFFPVLKGKKIVSYGYLSVFNNNSQFDYEQSLEKGIGFFVAVFDFVKSKLNKQWEFGDSEGGYIAMNVGVASIFLIVEDILEYVCHKKKINSSEYNDTELFNEVLPLLQKLTEHLDDDKIKNIRSTFGSGAPTLALRTYQKLLYDFSEREFNPPGLLNWIEEEKGQYKIKCRDIDEQYLRPKIRKVILNYLQEKFPNGDDWFYEGCPIGVLKDCSRGRTRAIERNEKPQEDHKYLNLIDYQRIIMDSDNYQELSPAFIPKNAPGKKEKKLGWFKKYETLRNKWSHELEREVTVSKEDLSFFEDLQEWLEPNLDKELS